MYSVEPPVLDSVAENIIHSSMKMAAAEGAGFGLGGLLTIVPDFSILAGITLRTVQKLSLIYGFEYNTDDEIVEKWAARLIPVVSSVIGGTLNYYFVRGWGERAHAHFRQKHLERRRLILQEQQSLSD